MTFAAEPVTPTTPRPLRRVVFTQTWSNLTFLHWAVDPALVAPLLPPGVAPDLYDGVTYVGVVPFHMRGAGLFRGPGLPYLGDFPETNVRLYSVDQAGRRGIVFRSLEASRLAVVLTARGLGVPYTWADMRVSRDGDVWSYHSARRWPGPRSARFSARIRVGAALTAPTALDHFLTARWGLHLRSYGRTRYWPVQHAAWQLHSAEALTLSDELVAAAGVPPMSGPPMSVLWSDGVRAQFGVPSSLS